MTIDLDWRPIDTAPRDGTRFLGLYGGTITIMWWTHDVYSENGGSGGPSGWFAGNYRDHWHDSPEFEHPEKWLPLPDPEKGYTE